MKFVNHHVVENLRRNRLRIVLKQLNACEIDLAKASQISAITEFSMLVKGISIKGDAAPSTTMFTDLDEPEAFAILSASMII